MSDQPGGEVILYRQEGGRPGIEVRLDGDTAWLTQAQMAELFETTPQNITQHLKVIYDEGELAEKATCKDYLQVRQEGERQVERQIRHYSLEAIIAVGYRVRSPRGTQFRIWATERLREYLVKGFTMDDAKLKNLGGGDYWRELLDRIRDIRSSEKVMYRQVLDLYATSIDYDPKADESAKFFKVVQNKLHYAAHGRTAAEVINLRADATQPNMGLTSFAGENPRKSDVSVAKNYLDENELKKLNTLVSAYFDAAEFRAQTQEPTYMKDWLAHLDRLIVAMEAPTLAGPGSVSHKQAVTKVVQKYREQHSDGEGKEIRAEISRAVDASPTLRNKKDLVESFVDSLSVDGQIDEEWQAFIGAQREVELDRIIEDEGLRPEETRGFIRSAFRDGAIQTTGTDIIRVLPPASRFSPDGGHGEKKQRVVGKLTFYFDRFFGLGADGQE